MGLGAYVVWRGELCPKLRVPQTKKPLIARMQTRRLLKSHPSSRPLPAGFTFQLPQIPEFVCRLGFMGWQQLRRTSNYSADPARCHSRRASRMVRVKTEHLSQHRRVVVDVAAAETQAHKKSLIATRLNARRSPANSSGLMFKRPAPRSLPGNSGTFRWPMSWCSTNATRQQPSDGRAVAAR